MVDLGALIRAIENLRITLQMLTEVLTELTKKL